MSHKTINQLPDETIKLIASTQIITSVSTVVKELMENSIDADSKNIQIKLENYGFDALEVKDDGIGVSYMDVQRMFLPGYTSKIKSFEDLGRLQTYGFRGEALSAIAKLATVSITTKTNADTLAMIYNIGKDGTPESSKPSHLPKGTVITVKNLFSKLPVRKQYLSSKKKIAEELKKVENVVHSLSLIYPELRVSLMHNKCPIWQKNSVKGLKQSFMQVVGLKIVSRMEHLNELGNNILVDLIIPKKNLEEMDGIFTSSNQSIYLYINRRPIVFSKLCKLVMEHIFLRYAHLKPTLKYAVCLISVELPSQEIDVNLEPNKTKIYIRNEEEVNRMLDQMLSVYYEQNIERPVLQEVNEKESEEEESFCDEPKSKRPRKDKPPSPSYVLSQRDEEFTEKNDGWHLETITIQEAPPKEPTLNMCSQINKENCTLTTSQEVGEMNKLLSEGGQKLVTSISGDHLVKMNTSNEIQTHSKEVRTDIKQHNNVSVEKPILPDWPVREVHSVPEIKNSDSSKVQSDQDSNHVIDDKVMNCLKDVSLLEWSRGAVHDEDGLLEGGVTLARPKFAEDERIQEDLEKFDLSMRSVSSQMGKKEMSAFSKFARIMRPKIVAEYPGIVFTAVADMLVSRWKDLSTDDKKYYEKLSNVVDVERKVHSESKSIKAEIKENPFLKKKVTDSSKKPERRELDLVLSIDEIMRKRRLLWREPDEDEIVLIGQLQPSCNWLYRKGSEIGHLRHKGMQELILSQKMFSSYSVPRQPLKSPIRISREDLGGLWDTLLSLEKEYDPITGKYTIVSDAITKNGFKIDLDGTETGSVTEVASMIPFFGMTELKETLEMLAKNDGLAYLGSLRSTSVINYITNEAIRIVQESDRPPQLKDLKEWLDTWKLCLTHLPAQCLHCEDIFVPIYNIGIRT